MPGRLRGSHGDSGPLEVVILLPAVLLLFALVVAFGRTTTATTDVEHAAAVGARAAAAAQTSGGASVRAGGVVEQSLADAGLSCVSQQMAVSGSFTPGGRVTVTVTCVVALGDVTQFGFLPGSRTLTASATEVIDRVRGGTG